MTFAALRERQERDHWTQPGCAQEVARLIKLVQESEAKMNRFGSKTSVDYDPDKEIEAAELNARAQELIAAGVITESQRRACFSLADLRKLVADAQQPPADVATPGAIDCPCADCEAKRQNLIAKGFSGLAKKIQHPLAVVPDTRTPEQVAKFKAEQERRNRNFKPSSPTHM